MEDEYLQGHALKGGGVISSGEQDSGKRRDKEEGEGWSDAERRAEADQGDVGPDREAPEPRKKVRMEEGGNTQPETGGERSGENSGTWLNQIRAYFGT
ncbi:hypothetical protein NDU88_002084 [Pleurodeles waltl]|uniref:Uncharacterized protein n=1 Tax=Pleurodeles waltl TaxID=8319 RepID=A0AAV7RBR1_PLEWA|nr:hypothetical protein NDU88_002084 [Pleurodeles waltl]